MLSVPRLSRQAACVIFHTYLIHASVNFQGTYLVNFERCRTSILAFRKYIRTFYHRRNLRRINWIHVHEIFINHVLFSLFLELIHNWRCGEDLQKLCHSVHIERRSHWRVDLYLKLFISLNELLASRDNYSLMTYIGRLRDFSRFLNFFLI